MSQQMLEKDVEPKKNKKLDRQTVLFSVRAQIAWLDRDAKECLISIGSEQVGCHRIQGHVDCKLTLKTCQFHESSLTCFMVLKKKIIEGKTQQKCCIKSAKQKINQKTNRNRWIKIKQKWWRHHNWLKKASTPKSVCLKHQLWTQPQQKGKEKPVWRQKHQVSDKPASSAACAASVLSSSWQATGALAAPPIRLPAEASGWRRRG